MRSRAAACIVFGFMLACVPAGADVWKDQRASISIDVTRQKTWFTGTIETDIARAGDRTELLFAFPAQRDSSVNEAMRLRLLGLLHTAYPTAMVVANVGGEASTNASVGVVSRYGGSARVEFHSKLDSADIRHAIERFTDLIESGSNSGDRDFLELIGIGQWFRSCNGFERDSAVAAERRINAYSAKLGVVNGPPTLLDTTIAPHPIEGPSYPSALCGPSEHLSRPTSFAFPFRAAFDDDRFQAFAQQLTVRPVQVANATPIAGDYESDYSRVRPRIDSEGSVLTVDGRFVERAPDTNDAYIYVGPNGRYFPRDAPIHMNELVKRLHAIGIDDDAIDISRGIRGQILARIRPKTRMPAERVVDAISGGNPEELRGITTFSYGASCAIDENSVALAVREAARRASVVGTSLGIDVDTVHPLLVKLIGTDKRSCNATGTYETYAVPVAHRLAGMLPPFAGRRVVSVSVSFRFSGAVRTARPSETSVASDEPNSWPMRAVLVAPAVDYARANISFEATAERRIRPVRVALRLDVDPDHAHQFHSVDPSLVSFIVKRLGLSDAEYAAATELESAADAASSGVHVRAVLRYAGSTTFAAIRDVQTVAATVALPSLSLVGIVPSCQADADGVAIDAVRRAIAAAKTTTLPRVVAIDVRGPFSAEGSCDESRLMHYSTLYFRKPQEPIVRLTAYARISMARR